MAVSYTESTASTVPAVRRVSWGAIFVGVVIAMVVQLLLAVLGIAIGASAINPLQESNPMDGIGMGAGIYWVVSSIIALFAGGYAAGALTTVQDHRDRTLHGIAVWGVAALFLFMVISSGVGRLIGGTASMIGGGASMLGGAVSDVAPRAMDSVQNRIDESDFDLDLSQWREEARQLLRDTGIRALQPDRLEGQAAELQQDIRSAANRAGQDPQTVDQELESVLNRIQSEGRETLRAIDREALVNIVSARTGQSRQEASQTVANWEQGYQQAYQAARTEWEQAKTTTEQKAREWGDQAADAVAKAAWWTFFMLLLGAIFAALGANVGANRVAVVREETRIR